MFSYQQKLSDKMMCLNSSILTHKQNGENKKVLDHQIAIKSLDELKNVGNKDDDIYQVTGLESRSETCKIFGIK